MCRPRELCACITVCTRLSFLFLRTRAWKQNCLTDNLPISSKPLWCFSLSLSLNAYVASQIMGCDHCKSHEPAPLCLVPHPHLVTSFNPQYFISLLISGNWLLFISVITVLDPLSVITVLDPLSVNTVLDPLSVITVFALIYRTA